MSKQSTNRTKYRRILQPILLGSLANIIVNYVFNPAQPDFYLSEFVVAILLSTLITELNFHIDKKLESRYSWTRSFGKRFFYHLGLLSICALFVLNIIGNAYVLIIGDDFYPWGELFIINLVLFLVLFLITFFNWGVSFYKGWKKTEKKLEHSNTELERLNTNLNEEMHPILCQQGTKQISITAKELMIAKSEHGVVRILMKEGKAIYQGPLQNLIEVLPNHLFFQISRNMIAQRGMIKSISSSTYGKVNVEIEGIEEKATVSRQKAASFRRWYTSGSSQN